MRDLEFHEEWLIADGHIVKIDGIEHKIKVSIWNAKYPDPYKAISVMATVVDRDCEYYQTVKRDLKDDWSTDILDSGLELQIEVMNQVRNQLAIMPLKYAAAHQFC